MSGQIREDDVYREFARYMVHMNTHDHGIIDTIMSWDEVGCLTRPDHHEGEATELGEHLEVIHDVFYAAIAMFEVDVSKAKKWAEKWPGDFEIFVTGVLDEWELPDSLRHFVDPKN